MDDDPRHPPLAARARPLHAMNPQPLPMAPSGCALDREQLAEQIARYRRLSANVLEIERHGLRARVRFDGGLQTELLDQAVIIERGCCRFFTLDYDGSTRVLTIATDPDHRDGLSTLLTALTPSGG
jgi:hypothetical protein